MVTFAFDSPGQATSSPFSLANLLLGSLEPYKTNLYAAADQSAQTKVLLSHKDYILQ